MVKSIKRKFRSHLHLSSSNRKLAKSVPSAVDSDPGRSATSYSQLVEDVAAISYWNRGMNLFFRGQKEEHRIPGKLRHLSLRPSIYRPPRRATKIDAKIRSARFDFLRRCSEALAERFDFDNKATLIRYPEVQWALLQHYGVCLTPLLDVTQSLRVACTFALENNVNEHGYVYVFGLPQVRGSMTYEVDEDLVLLKLQSICPPIAKRPHFQEGYLAGTFPLDEYASNQNFRSRLISKFRVRKRGFWGQNLNAIPSELLMPTKDEMLDLARDVQQAGLKEVEERSPLGISEL